MLRTEQLGFWYQNPEEALYKDVNLSFETGKMYAILGASGSGKTTFLSLISGLDQPKEGKVYYEEQSLAKIGLRNYRKNDVSIIFQVYNLLPYLSAVDNAVSYTHLRAHETDSYLVCRLLLEKKKISQKKKQKCTLFPLSKHLLPTQYHTNATHQTKTHSF